MAFVVWVGRLRARGKLPGGSQRRSRLELSWGSGRWTAQAVQYAYPVFVAPRVLDLLYLHVPTADTASL